MTDLTPLLTRLVEALERLSPPPPALPDFVKANGFVWHATTKTLTPVSQIHGVELALLIGIDHVRDILLSNTLRFAKGLPANNALLWGARGMGKSSLVKACVATSNAQNLALKLVEIHREDITSLPELMEILRPQPHKFILFCDDLSFDAGESSYKSLKTILEGGLEGRPANVILYATSNRRHILSRDMLENERSTAIHAGEAVEEKVSLSDRFGLWLGFHNCSQDDYLAMVEGYATYFNLVFEKEKLHRAALEWATTRGSRSGRVAFQFIQDRLE